MGRIKLSLSLVSTWAIALILIITVFNQAKWNNREVLKHDMYVYYSYLPATFIYNDLTFQFAKNLPNDDKHEIWTLEAPNGGHVQKMTMGMAMMYAPFFGLAHLTAKIMGYKADGYSWIYHFFMAMSAVVFAISALFIQRKILLKYFDDHVVALSLISIGLATNFYYYATSEGPMSHIHNFFLISLFIWQVIKWLENYNWINALVTGISLGLIILIRPVNIIVVLIPLLYSVRSFSEFILRIKDIFSHFYHVILMVAVIALILFPQLWYWHYNTGEWIYYSYNDEGFFFNDPKIIQGLFSFRKGWLIYSPIMSLSFLGLFFLWFRSKASKFRIAIPIYMALNLYIVFSWWCWWYGGSFGARPLLDATAIMSIPLAAFFAYTTKTKWLTIATTIVVLSFGALNLFQSMQYNKTIIHWDSMTKETYFLVWASDNFPEGYSESLQEPDYEAAKRGQRD